jgi:hypothetical protein
MRNLTNMLVRIFLLTLSFLPFDLAYSQTKCGIFTEYKNEIKIWAASTIDSLKKQGIDTILFYGVGVPNSGRIAYGKIIWTNKGSVKQFEIKSKYINNAFRLTNLKYDSVTNDESIQFYLDYRLDTVTTNPKELSWMSHDFLHFVYSSIHGTEVCFIAEHYLLWDKEHFRSRWIRILSENVPPYELCR